VHWCAVGIGRTAAYMSAHGVATEYNKKNITHRQLGLLRGNSSPFRRFEAGRFKQTQLS